MMKKLLTRIETERAPEREVATPARGVTRAEIKALFAKELEARFHRAAAA
ncbi:hypothetical protein [Roseovarius aestuariivivens]|nr:hypothetical protein [Roseovarius aestuariivivens]